MRILGAAILMAGCGYTSQYAAPLDGRPRAVWRGDAVVVERANAPIGPACEGEAALLASGERQTPGAPSMGYVPQYWGPPIVVLAPGFAPSLVRPPVFVPPPLGFGAVAAPGAGRVAGAGVGGASTVPSLNAGKGGEAVLAVLAVAAIIVLPVIDVALSLAPAESASRSAQAIDSVNALNELMRWPGSPCYPTPPGSP